MGDGEPDRAALAVGQQTVPRRLPDRARQGDVEEEQTVAAAQGAGDLLRDRHRPQPVERLGAPGGTRRAHRPHPGPGAEPPRRGDGRAGHREARARQFTVGQGGVADPHGPVGGAGRPAGAPGATSETVQRRPSASAVQVTAPA